MSPAEKARLRAIIDQYFDVIWRSLRRLGVPPTEMDDCMQQVFLVASRKLPSIAAGSEQAFLLGAALRVASNARRSHERRREVLEGDAVERFDPSPLPDDLTDQKRLREVLDEVLDAMPMDLRSVFVLFEIEELSTQEIAVLLGIPAGTAASRLRRAREEFDRLLARHTRGGATGGSPTRGGQS
ncbi:MAG: sigma-70 family RNA polymerase sigma factor [Polyangiaceae bacterium]|nr:sigma-70 family RNA polymerase sigma factor [Polyangiaceae bacterium]NUQ73057.1 sigma-70 family RNA polymerase sigma factor [Polyangiaceae bacterium]